MATEARTTRSPDTGPLHTICRRGRRRCSAQAFFRRQAHPRLRRSRPFVEAVVESGLRVLVPSLLHLTARVAVLVRVSRSAAFATLVRTITVATALATSFGVLVHFLCPTLLLTRKPFLVLQAHGPPRRKEHLPITHPIRRVLAQNFQQGLLEVRVPTMVLLAHPGRHPLRKNRVCEHLHERHAPAILPRSAPSLLHVPLPSTSLVIRAPPYLTRPRTLERVNKVLDTKAALLQREPGHQRRRLKKRTAPSPTIRHHLPRPHQIIPRSRGHVPPERNHTHASIRLVPIVEDLRTRSGHARRHHERPGLARGVQAVPADIILPIELIQRQVSDLRLHRSQLVSAGPLVLLPHQGETLVELINLALPRHSRLLPTAVALHFCGRFHAP